ncbi:hypothetical protein PIB30_081610 [Stylosanthes scabra]|uniref:Uncharacterized protein n=1 Tax=Stylosanthes scabra TaxID=79078 RepID=A0ABU6YS25_9FABA|nr:hypothetical protein [Stylosanthes scabra]
MSNLRTINKSARWETPHDATTTSIITPSEPLSLHHHRRRTSTKPPATTKLLLPSSITTTFHQTTIAELAGHHHRSPSSSSTTEDHHHIRTIITILHHHQPSSLIITFEHQLPPRPSITVVHLRIRITTTPQRKPEPPSKLTFVNHDPANPPPKRPASTIAETLQPHRRLLLPLSLTTPFGNHHLRKPQPPFTIITFSHHGTPTIRRHHRAHTIEPPPSESTTSHRDTEPLQPNHTPLSTTIATTFHNPNTATVTNQATTAVNRAVLSLLHLFCTFIMHLSYHRGMLAFSATSLPLLIAGLHLLPSLIFITDLHDC